MYGVRPMCEDDIPEVMAIEREAFPGQPPTSPESFQRELRNKLASYLVAYDGEGTPGARLLGYAGLWFIVDEAHLISLAVREDARRRGVGELLLIAALDLAIQREAQTMTLEVRVSNLPAQALYEKYGLGKVGRRRGYYPDNNEDAFLMTVEAIADAAYQRRLRQLKAAHAARLGAYQVALP
ncbi:MAG: ribosomal protein S18-alanine N-acetyltransferase [Chloroflexi bacterium]|nr:ribosomal protein S18-alanine N-acetyltransferase [Chloroflexota bacterium]